MSLLVQLKTELAEVLEHYQQLESSIEPEMSKAIEDFNYLTAEAKSVMELWRLAEWRASKMKGLFLGRFRNDLRYQLLAVLYKPDYDKFLLMAEDNERLRQENNDQKKENQSIRKLLDQYNLMPEDLRNLGEKLKRLEEEVNDYKQKYEWEKTASETYKQQITLLAKSVTKLETENSQLKTDLQSTKDERDALAKKCQEHIEEKAKLAERIAQLEAELQQRTKEASRSNNSESRPTSNYASFYGRPKPMAT